MKENRINLKAQANEECKYCVTIPLKENEKLSPAELSEFTIEVSSGGKIIDLQRQEKSYYFERTENIGQYIYTIKLKKGNELIEEQNILVNIKEEFNLDTNPIEQPIIEISDLDFFNSIKEIINSIDIKVGSRSYGWGVPGSTPIGVDNNSEVIFKDLKKVKRDEEIIDVLCQILSEQTENGLLIWKSVAILKHFRATVAISYVQSLAKQTYTNKNETRFLHNECIKYLESINTIRNKELVSTQFIYFATDCISPEARKAAMFALIKTGKRNDEKIIQFIFNVSQEETNSDARLTAIGGLSNYNLINHTDEIEELLQDADPKARQKTSNILLNNSLKLQFETLTNIFEEETDKSARTNICKLLFKFYLEEAKPFFIKILDWEDENYTLTLMDALRYEKDSAFIVPHLSNYQNFEAYSDSLNKQIDEFLKRHSK